MMKQIKQIVKSLRKTPFVIPAVLIGAVLFVAAGGAAALLFKTAQQTTAPRGYQNQSTVTAVSDHADVVVPSDAVLKTTSDETSDKLLYLVEEEKLAHDVYMALYNLYGVRVFSNISASETRHEESVLSLLDARGITDPRSSEPGVFRDQDLQKLYDTLMARGRTSVSEAYAVGVLIEQTDIADLDETLSSLDPAQTDIKTVVESLKRGSENHLRAFSRKV